jgi:hypothetical protein
MGNKTSMTGKKIGDTWKHMTCRNRIKWEARNIEY